MGFPFGSLVGLEQPSLEGAERRLEDGGGGPAGAQLAVRPPGSSGSGFQQHQELCRCARGSEGKAPIRQQGAVHEVGGGVRLTEGQWAKGCDSLEEKHLVGMAQTPTLRVLHL